jgi:hypothetical protein
MYQAHGALFHDENKWPFFNLALNESQECAIYGISQWMQNWSGTPCNQSQLAKFKREIYSSVVTNVCSFLHMSCPFLLKIKTNVFNRPL